MKNKITNFEPVYGIPEESTRVSLNRLIRRTARIKDTDHSDVWEYLYDMFKLNYGIDLRRNNMPPLDYAEKEGHIDKLYKLAQKIIPMRTFFRTSSRSSSRMINK